MERTYAKQSVPVSVNKRLNLWNICLQRNSAELIQLLIVEKQVLVSTKEGQIDIYNRSMSGHTHRST